MVSFPAPPIIVSLPGPPSIMSLPLNPFMVSLPPKPHITSMPGVPFNTSLPLVPVMVHRWPLAALGAASDFDTDETLKAIKQIANNETNLRVRGVIV
jgi:hypothetical protein